MAASEQDTSLANGQCRLHTRRTGTFASMSKRPPVPSVNSHEKYHHHKHIESIENATDTVSDDGAEPTHLLDGWKDGLSKSDQVMQMVSEMQKKISLLEQQLMTAGDRASRIDSIANDPRYPQSTNNEMVSQPQPSADLKQFELIAELHEASWSEFMNKSQDARSEYVIDILIGQPEYKRKREVKEAMQDSLRSKIQRKPDLATDSSSTSPGPGQEQSTVPDRIRINSPQLVSILATMDKNIDPTAALVLLRPFKLLVHFENRLRDIFRRLGEEVVRLNSSDETTDSEAVRINTSMQRNTGDINLNLEHMRCLIQFIDQYIKPTIERLKSEPAGKICFRDLWYIFQPGDDIFMPLKDRQNHVSSDPMTISPEMFQSRYERMWRVIGVGGGRPNLTATHTRNGRIKQNPFEVSCYYIDFDGIYFCPVVHTFSIVPFSGERDITALAFFPLRFLNRGEELRTKSQSQGKMVFEALLQSHTHFYYRGPTLVTHPCGCAFENETIHQEHVDSEVIIDYRTTLQKHPAWIPQTTGWKRPPAHADELQEKYRIFHWNDDTRSKLVRTELDVIHDDGVIDLKEALSYKDSTRIFDPVASGWLSNEMSVPEADVTMLSPRLFAFVLRTRSFAPVWLWGLQKISAQTEGLNNLQLRDNTFKATIHALVRTHFLQANSAEHASIEHDVVPGKGKGLVFLLHGAPGVGKTFTAESVAAANGRPLFQITCGDLGLTPTDVEAALKEIFRYAQLWNCVLLLDECDIFLTQRTKTDLKRNSLVSVFLRVLEWYNGVLFLTTNRVGTLDSAVKSRITWSTYYPPLNMDQTREIWKVNLNLLEKRYPNIELDRKGIIRFVKDHFNPDDDRGSNWNGRQIQNAFKVAVSLADWDTLSEQEQHATDTTKDLGSRKLTVTAAHFETVATAADAFDDYLNEATGVTEAQRAFNAQERFDDYTMEPELLVPEPPPKKRRMSSSASAFQQNHVNGRSNTGRRPSVQSPDNPRPRKSPFLQPKGAQTKMNDAYAKGAGPPAGGKSPVHRTFSNEQPTTFKRKRTGSEQIPPHVKVQTSPAKGGEYESTSDFDYAVDVNVSSEALEETDEWDLE